MQLRITVSIDGTTDLDTAMRALTALFDCPALPYFAPDSDEPVTIALVDDVPTIVAEL